MKNSGSRKSPVENHEKPILAGRSNRPAGPPPLPSNEESGLPSWLAPVLTASLACLLLILIIFIISPKPHKGTSKNQGVFAGTNTADGLTDKVPKDSNDNGQIPEDSQLPASAGTGPIAQDSDSQGTRSTKGLVESIASEVSNLDNQSSEQALDTEKANSGKNQPTSATPPTESQSADPTPNLKPSHQFFTLNGQHDRDSVQLPESLSEAVATGQKSSLVGRLPVNKAALLQTRGGTATTEAAVKLGLEWLARNQQEDGLWSLQGPYSRGGSSINLAAASAMALLAFQGAGHTHQSDPGDPFTKVVRKGWKGLIDFLEENRDLGPARGQNGGYTEALCTIALCELYGMTKDRRYRKLANEAVEYCLRAQSEQGGWRYRPAQDSDTSVSGWFLMALQSARMAKLKVPNRALARVNQYLNAAASKSGERYAYQPGTATSLAMTAEGLLCRQYLGWQRDDPRLLAGAEYLLQQLPDWETRDVYYWYYATQVTHHMGGDPWHRWNRVMRTLLPSKQIKEGNERGSWDPRGDKWGSQGGRLYVTCMSLYMLEVYYRYLPIYQHDAVANDR